MRNIPSEKNIVTPGKPMLKLTGLLLLILAIAALAFAGSGLAGVDLTGTIYLEATITDALSIPQQTEHTNPETEAVTTVQIWTPESWENLQTTLRSARIIAADGGAWRDANGDMTFDLSEGTDNLVFDTSQETIDAVSGSLRAAIEGLELSDAHADTDKSTLLPSGRAIDIYFGFILMCALILFVSGFLGIKFCADIKKARLLGTLGVVSVGLILAAFFFTAGTLGYTFGWMMLPVILIPILFTNAARRNDRKVATIIIFGLLVLMSLLVLFPMWWIIRSALMTTTEVTTMSFLPSRWLFSNFPLALEQFHFWLYLRNTLIIAVPSVVLGTGTAVLCGYSFARFHFRGKKFIFGLCIASMLLPPMVTLIPIFVVWTSFFNMSNSFLPLILPWVCGGGAFNIFLMRQFILTIPRELDEAAMIDGAGRLRILSMIIMPAIKPAIMVVGIFIFMQIWNDILTQNIYLTDSSMHTMALGLRVFSGSYGTVWNLTMVAAILAIIPGLIIYIIGQKYLVEGIVMTGMKN